MANSAAATNRYAQGDKLTIAGNLGTREINIDPGASAKTVAEKVDAKSSETGVKAFAKTEIGLNFSQAGAYTLNVQSDNNKATSISFTLSGTEGSDGLSAAVTAFNDIASKTGVTASDTVNPNAGAVMVGGNGPNGGVTLAADGTADQAVVVGQVTFDSDKSFGVSGTAGATTMNAQEASKLLAVQDMDISTVAGANKAMAIADAALNTVNAQRAKFGAIQSRFGSTIANLSTNVENLNAARSRIRDTDYAAETAELTRAQILQQAGVAMLAQANASPQSVLSLLK